MKLKCTLIGSRHFGASVLANLLEDGHEVVRVVAAAADDRLAIDGGPKAVREPPPRSRRWGEPERERLEAMLGQDSLFYWKGPQTALLVERFREVCPLEHVQTCSSGTAALHIAVAAAGIAPGAEVITSPITDIGTVIGVLYQQAVPVFANLGRNTYNIDPEDVARRIETICYIGRGNNPEFVFEYWQDPSGFTTPDIPGFGDDCLNYNPPDLVVEPVGGAWRVRAGSTDLQHFASVADANRGRAVLAQQDLLCYVHTRTPLPDDDPADVTYSFWGTD